MKRTLYTFLFLFAATVASAQNIDKIITKEYVDHLIKSSFLAVTWNLGM